MEQTLKELKKTVYRGILKKWNIMESDRTRKQAVIAATGMDLKELATIRAMLIKGATE